MTKQLGKSENLGQTASFTSPAGLNLVCAPSKLPKVFANW